MVNALAYLTMPALIGPVVGPPLGGFITTYFHWRWIFWINVPIGMLGVALSLQIHRQFARGRRCRASISGDSSSRARACLGLISGLSLIGRGMAPFWTIAN